MPFKQQSKENNASNMWKLDEKNIFCLFFKYAKFWKKSKFYRMCRIIKTYENRKSSGSDGFTVDFHNFFRKNIRAFVYHSLHNGYANGREQQYWLITFSWLRKRSGFSVDESIEYSFKKFPITFNFWVHFCNKFQQLLNI